jgi:hypothetical protein
MPTETLKTNMDTLFLPGPRFAILFLVIAEHAIQTRSRAYGPLFSVWMGIQLFVVISDACFVRNLLVYNGAITLVARNITSAYTPWPRHHCDPIYCSDKWYVARERRPRLGK